MLVNRCTADMVRVLDVFCGMIVVLMPGGRVLGDGGRRSRMMRGVALPRCHAARGK